MITINVKREGKEWAIYANGERVEGGFGSREDAVQAAAELKATVAGGMVSLDAALLAEAVL